MKETIEFYENGTDSIISVVDSSMVPPVDSRISIRGVEYRVVKITYALDRADDQQLRAMRANVDLEQVNQP